MFKTFLSGETPFLLSFVMAFFKKENEYAQLFSSLFKKKGNHHPTKGLKRK